MKYDVNDLAEMMTYMRPHNSETEKEFTRIYIDKVRGIRRDGFGNRFVKLGNPDTAFCSHIDTVHYNGGRHEVHIDKVGIAFTIDGLPLGGDDTTGVWLMLNMIYAGKSGLYIFHRGEERGGQGSNFISNNNISLLKGINKSVSLDRKGYTNIITHQGMKRTCSDKFAKALAKQLRGYAPCDTGVFTDSANYVYLVPECTNLSVGYSSEHTASEKQDMMFAEKLFHKLISVNWKSLPVERSLEIEEYKKSEYKPFDWSKWNHSYFNYGNEKSKNKNSSYDDFFWL